MNLWKRTSFRRVTIGLALVAGLMIVANSAVVAAKSDTAQLSPRVFKFKTSDPSGINIATQMRFQPSSAAKMQVSIQSGKKTVRIEFTVKSDIGGDKVGHSIEARYIEQIANSKPEVLRRPKIWTLENIPASLQIGDFHLEILIEPVN